jgi:DNA-binding transcriptional ArsR family regulator
VAKTKTPLIRSEKQLAALAAAARQEIFDVLEQMGTVSVAELAAALGRPADALYFHLRVLTRVGLVRNVGYRVRSGGQEALYCTVAPDLRLQYEPHNAANRKGVSAIVSSMLRLTMRDFEGSFQPGNVLVSGAHRELWALRKVGRLTRVQLAKLNQRINGLVQDVAAPGGQGRLYALTVILTPLDHRNKVDRPAQPKQRAALGTTKGRKK